MNIMIVEVNKTLTEPAPAADATNEISPCSKCGADLTQQNAVIREYFNKDCIGAPAYGTGHYQKYRDGIGDYFEPDRPANLSGGSYDNAADSDRCAICDNQL